MPTENKSNARLQAAAAIAGACIANPYFTENADGQHHATRFIAAAAVAVDTLREIEVRIENRYAPHR